MDLAAGRWRVAPLLGQVRQVLGQAFDQLFGAPAQRCDVGVAATKAGSKAAGVVIDDAAVTPSYVTEFTPDRELPIIRKIALGSLKNKLLILLPAALILSQFLPWAVTPLLMAGGLFLCFEGAEKVLEKLLR